MKITRDNYEEYFIDHFDGKLDAVQTAELFLFLDAHPDLKQEFELFGGLTLDEHTEHFDGKDSLKRGEITSANAGHYFVASLEGDLTPEEEQQLEQYVSASEERRKEQQLYMMTRLPAETVAFPGKAQLRQPIPLSSWFTGTVRYAAAAAIVLMILSGGYLVITRTQKGGVQMAEGTTEETPAVQEIQTEDAPSASLNSGSITGEPASAPSSDESAAPSKNTVKKQPAVVKHRQTGSQQLANSQPVIKQEVPETVQPIESINSPETEQPVAQQPSVQTQPEQQPVAMAAQPASGAGYMTVLQAVKQRAEKELTAQDETTPEQDLAALEGKRKGGVKVLGILSKGLQKVAGEKVSLSTAYDVDGQMMAYEFKAGGITIQK